jgi:hypothetical protein
LNDHVHPAFAALLNGFADTQVLPETAVYRQRRSELISLREQQQRIDPSFVIWDASQSLRGLEVYELPDCVAASAWHAALRFQEAACAA